jgi:hypothetical protein
VSTPSLHNWCLVYNDTAHTYMLNRTRCKSVTAVAKIVPDSYTLQQWDLRQVAIGMTLDRKLAERVAVDPTNRESVTRVCEDAKEIAKANDAARRGTQRHRASELFDLSEPLITDQQRADAAAWQRTIDSYGIQILPEYVEGFALWPDHFVAGRFDRIARYQGRTVILDLKSGENAVRYPQGTAVQLALYANAPMISAAVKTNGDKSTVTRWRQPPEDLDLKTGYVILLGDDMEVGELWEIDIAHGWVGAQHGLSIVDWRKEHNYGKALAGQVDPPSTPAIHNGVDRLLQEIKSALDEETLTRLWRTSTGWAQTHTEAAIARKAELQTTVAAATGTR